MSARTTNTASTAMTDTTVSTYLTDDNDQINAERARNSYKVRFSDGKAPGTADDGKINKDPHPHNQNFGRTGLLLIEGGTIILRILFDEKVKQTANGNVMTFLKMPANYQVLVDLYEGKVISPLQWDVLYPTNKGHIVTSLEFDIIILYILVIHTCQFKGEALIDIQKIEKRRDSLYDFTKDARIIDAKFETEYEAVGAVLAKLIVSRELGREVESRIKNMVKNLKSVIMTKEEILIYLDLVKRWYLSDIDVRKGLKELKPLLKAGKGDTKEAKDILAKMKMVASDDSNKLRDMKEIKDELEKLASDLEGIKKKKTKFKTVVNILSVLTPRFSQPFNIESVALSIPHIHRWTSNGVQFALSFYCQGQIHVYTKSTKLVVEAKLQVFVGDERIPEAEIAAIKTLNSSKFIEKLMSTLQLGGIGTLVFKERSFLVVPIESNEQGYRKLLETVKIPLWKTTISNIFEEDQIKSHLTKGGCLCISGGGDPTVMVDIRCRGSDIALSSLTGTLITNRPAPYEWQEEARKFVVKKYFLGRFDDDKGSTKGPLTQCVVVDLTVKKGTKIDPVMEKKFSEHLNDDKLDLKALLGKEDVSSVKCDEGKSNITITFGSLSGVKDFHDNFRYNEIKIFVSKLFQLVKVQKLFGNAGYMIYIDVMFCLPEVECKGLPEPASPTAPRHFKVAEVTSTSVTVSWEEPLSNGGINLTGYTIERYDVAEKKWAKVGVADAMDKRYHVTNLTTSHQYFFRITAENVAGVSPIVETSEPVMLNRSKVIKVPEIASDSFDGHLKATPRTLPKPKQAEPAENQASKNSTQTSEELYKRVDTKDKYQVKKNKMENTDDKIEKNPVIQSHDTKVIQSQDSKMIQSQDSNHNQEDDKLHQNSINSKDEDGMRSGIKSASSSENKKRETTSKKKSKSKNPKSPKSKKSSKKSSKKRQ